MSDSVFKIGESEIKEAISLWEELVSLPNDGRVSKLESLFLYNSEEAINDLLKKDKTNFSVFLLLDAYFEEYISKNFYSLTDILEGKESVTTALDICSKLRDKLSYSPIVKMRESFINGVRSALISYDGLNSETEEILSNRFEMSYLLYSALSSIDDLSVNQFLSGESDAPGFNPSYNKSVYQFWDVEEMLAVGCNSPSGISLCAIRDPFESSSYFSFMIRNGGNLFTLSDKPKSEHPLHKYMSRKPDRSFYGRIHKNMFPYDILDIEFNDEDRSAYINKSNSSDLIIHGSTYDKLKPLSQISSYDLIWTAIMFDMIKQRFWDNGFKCEELSYTASMINNSNLLIDYAKKSNLPISSDSMSISLPKLSKNTLDTNSTTEEEVGKRHSNTNIWMESKYSGQIDNDEPFNIISNGSSKLLINKGLSESFLAASTLVSDDVVSVPYSTYNEDYFGKRESRDFYSIEKNHIGTQKELDSDRKFIARHHFVRKIQEIANLDFLENKDRVSSQFKEIILSRKKEVFEIMRKEISVPYISQRVFHKGENCEYPLVKLLDLENNNYRDIHYKEDQSPIRFSGDGMKNNNFTCYFTGASSSYVILFSPRTSKDIELVLGCDPGLLHEGLANISKFDVYSGNSILSRVDPIEKLKNPWDKINTKILIYLSKRGLKKMGFEKS